MKLLIIISILLTLGSAIQNVGYVGTDVLYYVPKPYSIDPKWRKLLQTGPDETIRLYPDTTLPKIPYNFLTLINKARPTIGIRVCQSNVVRQTSLFLCFSSNDVVQKNSFCNNNCGFKITMLQNAFSVIYNNVTYSGVFEKKFNYNSTDELCITLQQRLNEKVIKLRALASDTSEIMSFDACKITTKPNRAKLDFDEILVWAFVNDRTAKANIWVVDSTLIAPGRKPVESTTTETNETPIIIINEDHSPATEVASAFGPLNVGVIVIAVGVIVSVVLFCVMYWINRMSPRSAPVNKTQVLRSLATGSGDQKKPVKAPSASASKKEVITKSSRSTKQRYSDGGTAKQNSIKKAVRSQKERQKPPSTLNALPAIRNKSILSRLQKRKAAPRPPPPQSSGFLEGHEIINDDESTMPTVTPQMANAVSKEPMTAVPSHPIDETTAEAGQK